jgi:hypothetical protein
MSKDFRKATDDLLASISHDELAKALGCSVATLRQARLAEGTKAHRNPPDGWQKTVAKLAESRAAALAKLAGRLKSNG